MSYNTKVYTEHGGLKQVVASGGEIEVQSGGTLDVQSGSTLTLAGTNTVSGATSVSSAVTVASGGSITLASGSTLTKASGSKEVEQLQSKAANYTVLATESGATFYTTAADVVFTLPSTAAGLIYRFICYSVSASTGLSVSPAAADKIIGSCGAVAFTATDNKDAINTGATDVAGDSITLLGDGADGWFIIHSTGVWAREA